MSLSNPPQSPQHNTEDAKIDAILLTYPTNTTKDRAVAKAAIQQLLREARKDELEQVLKTDDDVALSLLLGAVRDRITQLSKDDV